MTCRRVLAAIADSGGGRLGRHLRLAPPQLLAVDAVGAGSLGMLALRVRGFLPLREGSRPRDLLIGAATAALLYGVFAVGGILAGIGLLSAEAEIGAVYRLRAQAPGRAIMLLLMIVIGLGEELFWRGLVQWGLVRRLGSAWGWAGASLVYGLVHAAAGNVMLVLAATIAGGFWGWLYLAGGRISPVIVSMSYGR